MYLRDRQAGTGNLKTGQLSQQQLLLKTMRGYVVAKYTHPNDLQLATDVLEPMAGPGQVIIDIYSAGLNYFDVSITLFCIQNKHLT